VDPQPAKPQVPSSLSLVVGGLAGCDLWGGWVATASDWYRLADGRLNLQTDHHPFAERFRSNYRECLTSDAGDLPATVCQVRVLNSPSLVVARLTGSPLPWEAFPRLFLDAADVATVSPVGARWQVAQTTHPVGEVAFAPDEVILQQDRPWQVFVAGVAVSRTLSAQQHVLFFHAAAIAIDGRGFLLLGLSGTGKTSISLELAARGHDFYGDDLVGVEHGTRALVPLRRAAHVRRGPSSRLVRAALSDVDTPEDSDRKRAVVGELFPRAGAKAASLDYVICLRSFSDTTCLEAFDPSPADLSWVTPYASSVCAGNSGSQTMRIISLFSEATCFFLDAASPDGAADALEQIAE